MATHDDIYGEGVEGGGEAGASVLTELASQFSDALGAGDEPEPDGPSLLETADAPDEGDKAEAPDAPEKPETTPAEEVSTDAATPEGSVSAAKYEALMALYNKALSGDAEGEAEAADESEPATGEPKAKAESIDNAPLRGTYRPFNESFVDPARMKELSDKHGADLVEFAKDLFPVMAELMLPDAVRLMRENGANPVGNTDMASRQYQSDVALTMFLKENPHWRGKDAILRSAVRDIAKTNRGADPLTLVEKLGEFLDETFYDAEAVANGRKSNGVKSTPKNTTTNPVSKRGAPAPKPDPVADIMGRTARFNQGNNFKDPFFD